MHEKLIEMVLKIQMDDYHDAKMLLEYADEAKMLGANSLANSFAVRAKARLNNMAECDHTLQNLLQDEDDDRSVFATLYHKFINKEHEHLKKRIETF